MDNKKDEYLDAQLVILILEYKSKGIDVHEFVRLTNIMYQDYLDFNPQEREKIYARFSPKVRPGL